MRSAAWAALLAWLALPAWTVAQVTINAEISKSDVSVDEQIALTVTVAGPESSLPDPQMPALTNLSVYDSGRSQSLSIINGRVSSSIIHTFVVIPRAVGAAEIPAISVTYKGQTVRTEPLPINVRKPDSGMPGAPGMPRQARRAPAAAAGQRIPEVFITAETDKKKAFVNEQVTLSVKFYTSVNLLKSPQYVPPALSGFLAEDLPPERHGTVNMHGRTYYYSEIRTALFPAQEGRLSVGAAAVRCELQPDASDLGGDLFDRLFSQGFSGRQVELRSDPVTLTSEALPAEGKPASFSGAVGKFSASAAVDRTSVKAGDAVTLTVTVTGQGNLKAAGDPVMPDMPSLRAFETVSSLNLDKQQDIVRGSKVFKTVVVPRVSGQLTIPPIRFEYFDPSARGYRRAETAPIVLNVAPGDAPAAAAAGPGDPSPRAVTAVSQDIRYLKTAPLRSSATRFLEAAAAAGPLHAAPFAAFILALAWTRYRSLQEADPLASRARSALRAAAARVKAARNASDPATASALLSDAFTCFLADTLRQPASGLTAKRAQELLLARAPKLPRERLEQVRALWDELDRRRYAPAAAGDDAALADRVMDLLSRIDREAR